MHQRGAALLVALAALALMSVFAVTIVTVVRVERKASAAYVDDVRAALVAQAGVERALWKLSDSFREPLTSDPYPWAYLDVSGRDASGLPLEGASRVSLQTGLLELESNGRLPFSGCLGGTYQQGGDVYALKILDASSQIDLNDEWPGLASALDVLGVAIGELRGRDPVRKRRAAIVPLPHQEPRITSKLELAAVLGDDD